MNRLDAYENDIARVVLELRRNFDWYDRVVRASPYDATGRPSDLPFVDEKLLEDHYYDADHDSLPCEHVYRTSGTASGRRKRILYSAADHRAYLARRRAIFQRFIPSDCRTACADLGTGHAAASARELFKSIGLRAFDIDVRRPLADHVRLLNDIQPHVLFTMPMILDGIIVEGAAFSPRKIILVGDVAPAVWKDRIATRFGLTRGDIMDLYGSIEVGSIAYECHACGYYHFDEAIVPEARNAAEHYGDPALAGLGDVLVLTSTERTYFPALRYVSNDRVGGFAYRRCRGREYATFECLRGRLGAEIKHGEKLSLHDISTAVHECVDRVRFEVHKHPDRLVIRVASPCYTPDLGLRIVARLRELSQDLDQMLTSGLVGPIEVEHVAIEELGSKGRFKQAIHRVG
jgi:fumarate---(S)-2,3-diaminopropanoate ligase